MKVRVFATVCCIAVVALLGGCAGTPDGGGGQGLSSNWDNANRPQMLLPGAIRSDVRGLAMGAARSKGWTIVKSSDDMIVMQRPIDPASPTAAAASVTPPVVEVTSAFFEQADGVRVALGAELVTQPPGEKSPKRIDYTDNYRDVLNRSLESLRANWTANRQRLASAMPPLPAHSEPPPAPDAEAAKNPLVQSWAEAVGADGSAPAAPPGPAPASAPPAAEPRMATAPTPKPATQPTPQPRPEPAARTASGPAPVVDGSRALGGGSSSPAPAPAILPPAAPEPVSPRDNMLALSEPAGTAGSAYYAEQYARLRGCNVADQGAQLIETRSDGELYKVPCTGADSFLLKCQNGACRGLE